MRIAIFSDNFYPEISGISDSVIALSKQLAKRGHFVDFYVPFYSKEDYEKVHLVDKEIDLGKNIKVHRFNSFPYKTGTGQGRFVIPDGFRSITIFRFHPDVIHTQLFFGVGLEAIFAARILKKPVVGTNHTALKEFLKYSPFHATWFNSFLLKYVNWYYERCELVTAPSKSVFDEMDALGFKNVKSQVVSNPIDTIGFKPVAIKTELKKKFGFNETTIIHAGRMAPERSPEVIIKALAIAKKKVPSAMLAFVGSGSYENDLRALAKNLGVGDSVKFLGFVEKNTLAEAYAAADLFAIASTADTQSMVMMQAMAAGLPVIGVRARGLPEYISPEGGFVVEPNNEQAMAEKMVYIFENKDAAKKLGVGARTYVEQFSEEAIATDWEAIYASVIKSYNQRYNI